MSGQPWGRVWELIAAGGLMKTQTTSLAGSTNTSALTFPGHAMTDFSKIENSILFDYSNCKVAQAKLRRLWRL